MSQLLKLIINKQQFIILSFQVGDVWVHMAILGQAIMAIMAKMSKNGHNGHNGLTQYGHKYIFQ